MYTVCISKLAHRALVLGLLTGIMAFSTESRAEYYFSYSMPETCSTCSYPSSAKTHRTHHAYAAKKSVKKMVSTNHHKVYHRYHCETYQPGNSGWVPGYWINGYWVRGSYYSYQETHATRSHRYGRYNTQHHNDYNPDMTTGDDDTWVNPGMNIDY